MRANSRMLALMRSDAFGEERPWLPDDVEDVMAKGWYVSPGGACILAALRQEGRPEPRLDVVGRWEYDINHVHISLSDLHIGDVDYLPTAATRGIYFAKRMLADVVSLAPPESLRAVVAVTTDTYDENFPLQDVNVRFFTERGEYPTWFDDLERFEQEAIAVLEPADVSEEFTSPEA